MIFEKNMHIIQRHNLESDLGHHTYRLGMNEFGDLTNEEFRKLFYGYNVNATKPAGSTTFLAASNVELPDTVDWRTKGYVTPVKNQVSNLYLFKTTLSSF